MPPRGHRDGGAPGQDRHRHERAGAAACPKRGSAPAAALLALAALCSSAPGADVAELAALALAPTRPLAGTARRCDSAGHVGTPEYEKDS